MAASRRKIDDRCLIIDTLIEIRTNKKEINHEDEKYFCYRKCQLDFIVTGGLQHAKTNTHMPTQTAVVMPATGVEYHFVTNKLLIPTTQEQTQAFALNVDGDSQEKSRQQVWELFTLLTSAVQDIELQSTLDQAVNSGQLVSLHDGEGRRCPERPKRFVVYIPGTKDPVSAHFRRL